MKLYILLKNVIARGNAAADMEDMLDAFRATNKLTAEEYNELMALYKGPSEQ